MSQKEFNIKDFNERCEKVINFLEACQRVHQKWNLTQEEELEEVKVRS